MVKKIVLVLVCIAFYPIALPVLAYRSFMLRRASKEFDSFITQENSKLSDKEAYEKLSLIINRAKNGNKYAKEMCLKLYGFKINKKLKNCPHLFDDDWEFLKKNYYESIIFEKTSRTNEQSLYEFITPDLPTKFSEDGNFSWLAVPNTTPETILECMDWNQLGSCNWQGLNECIAWKDFPFDCIRNGNAVIQKSAFKKLKKWGNGIFISPAVEGWCFLIDYNDVFGLKTKLRAHMLKQLSSRFGSALFFDQVNNHDAIGLYQRFDNGTLTRSAEWCEDTPPKATTLGQLTSEEKAMGIHQIDAQTASITVPKGKPNEHLEMRWIIDDMVDQWSIHPNTLDQRSINTPDIGNIMLIPMELFSDKNLQ